MSVPLRKTAKAVADLFDIAAYIADHNPDAGRRFLAAADEELLRIAENPGIGRLRQLRARRLKGFRSWPIRGFRRYLVFYRATADEVEVFRVLHGARDLERALVEP